MLTSNIYQFCLLALPLLIMVIVGMGIEEMYDNATLSMRRHAERQAGIVCMLVGLFILSQSGRLAVDAVSSSLRWNDKTATWSAITIAASLAAGFFIHRKARPGTPVYQMRQLPEGAAPSYFLVWVMYLLLYEFYFRNLLLPVNHMPAWLMWSLNLGTYALLHLPHGRQEAVASIPYGVLLGVSAIATGCIWPAFLGHIALVASTQFINTRLAGHDATNSTGHLLKH